MNDFKAFRKSLQQDEEVEVEHKEETPQVVGFSPSKEKPQMNLALSGCDTATSLTLSFDVAEVVSLSSAVAKLNTAKNDIKIVIKDYQKEVYDLEVYYKKLKEDYETSHGTFDPNAPPEVLPLSHCARGQACQLKPGVRGVPDAHKGRHCTEEVDGFLGVNTGCNGFVYRCDPNYLCSRYQDHLIEGSGCKHKEYPRYLAHRHKYLNPGPCGHTYYACEKGHDIWINSCRVLITTGYIEHSGMNYVNRVRCQNTSGYYKCNPHTHSTTPTTM